MTLFDKEVLVEAQSPGLVARTNDEVPSGVPESKWRRFGKDRGVKPAVGGRIIKVRISIDVRPLADRTSSNVGDIPTNAHANRQQ